MGLEKKTKIIKTITVILMVLAAIFIVAHIVRLYYPPIFKLLFDNIFIGFIPSIFDKIIPFKVQFGYRQVSSGYFSAAIFCTITVILLIKLQKFVENKVKIEAEQEEKRKFVVEAKNKSEKEKKIVKQARYKETFFGLFELNVTYNDSFGKDMSQLEKLKIGYYKILVNKLKSKYYEVDFIIKDKVFFISNNYALLKFITEDLLRVLGVVVKTGKANQLKTEMRFSYWLDEKTANKMSVFKTLSMINELDNINKIVMTKELYSKIIALESVPWCEVNELGMVTLFGAYNNLDIPVTLCEITSIN